MPKGNSKARRKPAKPRKDFPLFAHRNGQWAKKVLGRLHYFGTWDDPREAEKKWDRDKHALLEGRDPNENVYDGDTIGYLLNAFLGEKKAKVENEELSQRTYDDYRAVCNRIAKHFGKHRRLDSIRAVDLASYKNNLPSKWSAETKNLQLRYARVIFGWASDYEILQVAYRKPLANIRAAVVRKEAAKKPAKVFSRSEIHRLLKHSGDDLRAFILLGLNCAYIPADIGRLCKSDIDFTRQWLGVHRAKTGMGRGAWLWPETIQAIKQAMNDDEDQELAFLTKYGNAWWAESSGQTPIATEFKKAKDAAGIEKAGVGIAALRHVFRTISDDARDEPAIDFVMGHKSSKIADRYREGIDPRRVQAVCEHVRRWLFEPVWSSVRLPLPDSVARTQIKPEVVQ